MWEKIVFNLLSNAFKFTHAGTVGLRVGEREGRIELVVCDSGVGIPAGELTRVFERFHRVEGARSRTHEGSGIGLGRKVAALPPPIRPAAGQAAEHLAGVRLMPGARLALGRPAPPEPPRNTFLRDLLGPDRHAGAHEPPCDQCADAR